MLSWLLFSNTSCRTGSSCDFVFFLSSCFCFCFVVLVPVLVFRGEGGGGEEKGTVAEVCVTRGVRACVRACVCARQSRGGTAALWRVGEEVSSPQVDAEDATHGCY